MTKMQATGRYSPLRYPGGKGKLAAFVAELIRQNHLSDGTYVEPYAGGAAVAWELLLSGVVRHVEINDLNSAIHAFWWSVLNETEALCRLIQDTEVTVDVRDRCKSILSAEEGVDLLELGFATFFLNRTHRSGILNGSVIGGRDQSGPWKIDARFNKSALIARIEAIARYRSRIRLSNLDAVAFLKEREPHWRRKTLVYLDPPYFRKGRQLYYDYYRPEDHAAVAAALSQLGGNAKWIVSYDDVSEIRLLYMGYEVLTYGIGYSVRDRTTGGEVMFFSPGICPPPPSSNMIISSEAA
jgi:DNA adenine methylase